MSNKMRFFSLGGAFKFFVLGSFVATRTASGSPDPDDALRHEMAWMAVRDGLSDAVSDTTLSADVLRAVEHELDGNLDFRVAYTYGAIAPDEIADLDALWMDHLSGLGTAAEDMDRFLGARTAALSSLVSSAAETRDSSDQLRNVVREINRKTYGG